MEKRTKRNLGWMMLWIVNMYKEEFDDLDNRYNAIGGMLSRMIDRADDFCKYAPSTDYRSVTREEEESPFTDH